MLLAPNLSSLAWLTHGFGQRDSVYPDTISTVKQIHSSIVLEASSAHCTAEADALVTQQPGLVAGVRTADCVPVLLADVRNRSVACIHAGWRGTAKNIAGAAVQELITRYGARPEDLYAAIGPSIGPCCYKVGPDVGQQFQKWTGTGEGGKLDLADINQQQLREAGVKNIWSAGICTFCNPEQYFSFRREQDRAGRMLSFIGNTSGGARR